MSALENLAKKDLIFGAEKIIKEGIPNKAHSVAYNVFYKNELLPPKLVVSYANINRNGKELDRSEFKGGKDTECFQLLIDNGFDIYPKHNIYPVLLKFLDQVNHDNLKTSKYPKELKGFKTKISFGQGTPARVPWISFLLDGFATSNGIYPVYLFYKKINLLVLAYGISETNEPDINWKILKPKSISQYFQENNFVAPERYGSSFVFKTYDVKNLPNSDIMDRDLEEILAIYRSTVSDNIDKNMDSNKFNLSQFNEDLVESGLIYSELLVTRFAAALLTKPFVILTGLSGSGKTKLAQSFAQWLCQSESQYCMVPVGADWTNREPLLGYPNALEKDNYVEPDNDALKVVLSALENKGLPHFLILDEMNLSHVERYFADFLSVMESKESIGLHSSSTITNIPEKLRLPDNLFIIGTVNIDETTNMFSPKVLDRANTIEFRIDEKEMSGFFDKNMGVDLGALKCKGAGMGTDFVKMSGDKQVTIAAPEEVKETLLKFFSELKRTGAEFGYRTATEIMILIHQLSVLQDQINLNTKLDIAIIQKLLPKLHGSRRKLCPVLETLAGFCITENTINLMDDVFKEPSAFNYSQQDVLFPLSLEKIARMYKGAVDNGFASFAEA